MSEIYNVDYRHIRDFLPSSGEYDVIESISLAHCQSKIPNRPHIPLRFVGVVPQYSHFAKRGYIWIPNCVNERYINNIFKTWIEGIFCQAWSVVEPECSSDMDWIRKLMLG